MKRVVVLALIAALLGPWGSASGGTTAEGSDGRKIAYPIGWMTAEGSDGRKIAYLIGDDADLLLLILKELDLPEGLRPKCLFLLEAMGYINSDKTPKSKAAKKAW